MSSLRAEAPLDEAAEVRRRRPLPRALLDVPVGEHEAAGDRLQRVDRRVGVVDGLQPVRPVDGRRHARVERLDRRQQVARRRCPAGGRSCPTRGRRRRSTGSASSRRRSRAARSATCAGACRSCPASRCRREASISNAPSGTSSPGPTRGDLVADHEDVRVVQDVVGVVHGQHGAAAQDDRAGRCSIVRKLLSRVPLPPPSNPSRACVKPSDGAVDGDLRARLGGATPQAASGGARFACSADFAGQALGGGLGDAVLDVEARRCVSEWLESMAGILQAPARPAIGAQGVDVHTSGGCPSPSVAATLIRCPTPASAP